MSEHRHLSEMAGINSLRDAESEHVGSLLPLNLLLILLGAAIMGVSFYFLDANDPRWQRNPWTYAIATPIVLLLLSILLSTLVSRIVEKSMQMAFLISVLLHLLLLIYAVNIVLFSDLWPDVLDSLTAQRQQLKRESLQAKLYHRPANESQTANRPDYLRFVPTEHQPTEVKDSQSPAIQLARAERVDLVSPSPQPERTASPHLLAREQEATSTPDIRQQAASLSRSEIAKLERDSQAPPSTPIVEPRQPILEASQAPSARRSGGASLAAPSATDARETARSASVSALQPRAEMKPTELPEPSFAPLALSARADAAPAPPGSVPPSSMPAESMQSSPQASSVAAANRRSSSSASAVSAAAPGLIAPPLPTIETSRRMASATSIERSNAQMQVPSPSAGDTPMQISRNVAGGTTGPAAANSMRVQGPDRIAAPESDRGDLRAAPSQVARQREGSRRATAELPEVGVPQSQSWDGRPSFSAGLSGTSPAQLAEAASSGNAAAQDVTALMGSGEAIARAEAGVFAPRGANARAGSLSDLDSANVSGSSSDGDAASLNPAAGAGGNSRLSRSNERSPVLADPTTLPTFDLAGSSDGPESGPAPTSLADTSRDSSGLPNGFQRATGTSAAESTSQQNPSPRAIPRAQPNPTLAGGPQPSAVELSTESFAGDAGAADFTSPTSSLERSRSRSTPQSSSLARLELEAVTGPGGVSPLPNLAGSALPNRLDVEPLPALPQIESQRFTRQEVGGPLAAGRDTLIPKPAFQQRLERLQERGPMAESAFEPQTELAIERGLAFLAKNQRPDGSWRLQDFDTPVLMRSDTAATGLCLLAFQGAGYTHQQFKYADTVDRAIQFLAKHQTRGGDLYIPQDPASDQNAWLYSHGIATLALCEAYGMTQDEKLRPVAQKAIDFMSASQDPRYGGWRYRPGVGTDTSVTGWFMMAFKSGQLAGLNVPQESFDKIEKYLQASQASTDQPHLYRYNPFAADTPQQRHGLQPTPVMTSVGLLMRLYFGWQRDKPEMEAGADHLLTHMPDNGTRNASLRDTYYWYYATQVIFYMGGERWKRWHDQLYPLLISQQVAEGNNAGSWDPLSPTPDLWARYGGRLYVTTMNLLSLEVSYRHLPLYEATGH